MASDSKESLQKHERMEGTGPKGEEIIIFPEGGGERTGAEFSKAIEAYHMGKQPKGFAVMPKYSLRTMARQGFEVGNKLVQGGAEKISKLPNIKEGSALDAITRTGGGSGDPNIFKAIKGLYDIGLKKGAPFVAENIDTPEKLISQLAGGTTAKATTRMSGLLPKILRTAAPGIGSLIGSLSASDHSGQTIIKKALLASGAAGTGEGLSSLLGVIFKSGMSKAAARQVEDDILDIMKKEGLQHQGADGLKAVLSVPSKLKGVVQAGFKGLRSSNDEMISMYINKLNSISPRRMGKVTERHIKQEVEKYIEAADDFFDNINSPKALEAARTKAVNHANEIKKLYTEHFSGTSGKLSLQQESTLEIAQHELSLGIKKLEETAHVLAALERSGAKGGFDVISFQEEMKGMLHSRGRGIVEDVGMAAGRGVSGGVDKPLNIKAKGALSKYIIPDIEAGKFSTRHSGKVRGAVRSTVVNPVLINEFLETAE